MPNYTFFGADLEQDEILFLNPETDEPYFLPIFQAESGGDVSVSHISTYPARQIMGDWLRSDHEVVSSYTQSDFTGGGQIWDADEGADLNRFWFGTLGTRHPGQMTLPLKSYRHEDPVDANIAIPLGDFGIDFYAAFGLRLVTATDQAVVDKATLAHVPVAKPAVVFESTPGDVDLYIAMGSNGYQSWDGIALSAVSTVVKPIQFMEWDQKLYALQSNGQVYESINGTTWELKFSVPSYSEPRGIISFYDASNKPTPFVICRRGVYAIDMSLGKAYKTKLDPPPHADAGLAAATWREDLHVSYGIGMHTYTGESSIVPIGLDRDDGVPRWLNGRVCSMAGGYNGLYALVQGYQSPTAYLEPSFVTDLSWHDFYMSPSSTTPALMMWDGTGWHTVWMPEDKTRQPTSMLISTQPGRERLWWGVGNHLYWQDVHHMYYNPAQREEGAAYEKSGWLETAIHDYSMDGVIKILHQVEAMTSDCTDTERIWIEYKIDNGPWTMLPYITTTTHTGKHVFPIGKKGMFPDSVTPRADGAPFIDVRFRILMDRGDDETKTPLLESISSVFHKVMSPMKAFTFTTGLAESDSETMYKGRSIPELTRFIDRMVSGHYLVPMLFAGEWHSVRFSGSAGTDASGVNRTGVRTVTALEVLE